jgi:hypothetical protein
LAPFREMGTFPEVLISRAPSRSAPLKERVALRQFYLVLSEVCGFREVRPEEVHPEDEELPLSRFASARFVRNPGRLVRGELWIATGPSRIWVERLPRVVEAQFIVF